MTSQLQVDYYTDILCVWAWIAQRRVDEIEKKWGERGGYAGFAEHVEESAAPFESAPVNSDVWREVRPYSSAVSHLILTAAELTTTPEDARKLAVTLRSSFFIEALNIGKIDAVLDIACDSGFDKTNLMSAIESGQAYAALMADYEQAQELRIKGSPSWVLNSGRQIL